MKKNVCPLSQELARAFLVEAYAFYIASYSHQSVPELIEGLTRVEVDSFIRCLELMRERNGAGVTDASESSTTFAALAAGKILSFGVCSFPFGNTSCISHEAQT